MMYRDLMAMVLRNGPIDEPSLGLKFGEMMANDGRVGQAARLIDRSIQLRPGNPEAELAMAKMYIALRQPAKALALARQLHGATNISAWELARCEAVAYMASRDYAGAEKVLREALRRDPHDPKIVAALAEFYKDRGSDELRQHKKSEAARSFGNALTNINLELQMLAAPSQGVSPSPGVAEALFRKADVEIMLESYAEAAATLSQVLQQQPDNHLALLNRAAAEIQMRQFQAARDDYKELRKRMPGQTYVIDFGLANVAAAEKNTAEEMAQLERCVKSAPEDSGAYHIASQRLAKLQGR